MVFDGLNDPGTGNGFKQASRVQSLVCKIVPILVEREGTDQEWFYTATTHPSSATLKKPSPCRVKRQTRRTGYGP